MDERAGEPRHPVLLPGRAYYGIASGAGFTEVMSRATTWFDQNVRAA